jgi:phage shock protein A
MGIISGLKNFFKKSDAVAGAKINEAAEKLEEGNEVILAKEELAKMKKDLEICIGNIASIESMIITQKAEIEDKKQKIEKYTKNAEELLALDKEDLASKNCEKAENLQKEVDALEAAMVHQEKLISQHVENRDDLKDCISDSETQLNIMKSQSALIESNKSLQNVNLASSESARSKFEDRKKKLQGRLEQSASVLRQTNEMSGKSLEDETEKALGKKSALLEKLKAKKTA